MIKWILVLAVVVILLGLFAPQLARLGLWKLPGDLRFKRNGREYFLPDELEDDRLLSTCDRCLSVA